MKTFKCNFGRGVVCEYQAPETAPKQGEFTPRFEWTGKPTPRLLRPYIAWVNSVNKTLCDEWGISLIHVFLTGPNRQETWVYTPGRPPKKISVPSV